MATSDDDSFTAPPERLLQDAQARPDGDEPAWVRARATELLNSLDDFQVPIGGKQRLLLRLGQGSHGRRSRLAAADRRRSLSDWHRRRRDRQRGAHGMAGMGRSLVPGADVHIGWFAGVTAGARKAHGRRAGADRPRARGGGACADCAACAGAACARPASPGGGRSARATSGGRRASRRRVPGRGRDARAARRTRPTARARPGEQLPRSPTRRRAGRRSAGHLHRSGHRSSRSGRGSFERQVPRAVPARLVPRSR